MERYNWTDENLASINSITKYPSIPTYHALERRGRITEELQVDFENETAYVTEKVDGTNARIIVFPGGDSIIGSRTELLWSAGDRIVNPAMHIVKTVIDGVAHPIAYAKPGYVTTIYMEVFGAGIQAAGKQYAGKSDHRGVAIFDVMRIPFDYFDNLMAHPPHELASWRDRGYQTQHFVQLADMRAMFVKNERLVPMIASTREPLPKTPERCCEWLRLIAPETRCGLVGGKAGRAEGIVIRNADRSKIAKLRFEDYRGVMPNDRRRIASIDRRNRA